jgi:outer membrane protein
MTGWHPLLAAGLLIVALGGGSAHAARAGDLILQGGLFHLAPRESSEPLQTDLAPSLLGAVAGIQPSFSSEGTATSVSNEYTPALTLSYFLTDHWVIKAEGGIPAEFELYGEGVVRPTGPTGLLLRVDLGAAANNPIASVRQWSPALLLQRYFRAHQSRLRPYLGVGVTYAWFTDVALKPTLRDELARRFGAPLALATGNPGPTSVSADSDADWAPIVNAGLSYALGERWSLSLSASYLFLETTSRITIAADNGTRLAESTTALDLGTVVSSVLLYYRWGGE